MKFRWKIAICLTAVCGIAALTGVAGLATLSRVLQERERDAATVFQSFEELGADLLHNGFGVYVLRIRSDSRLSDNNVNRLLLLNDLPQDYDLTVLIETESVTDASIDTLARLTSVDSLILDKSGLTADGVDSLRSRLPAVSVSGQVRPANPH